jgi:hypothetical protein
MGTELYEGVSSWQKRRLRLAVERAMLQAPARDRRKFMRTKPWYKQSYWIAGIIASVVLLPCTLVVAVIVVNSMMSKSTQGTATAAALDIGQTFRWTDQVDLPQSFIGLMVSDKTRYVTQVVAQLYGAYTAQSFTPKTVTVPNDQSVIVVAQLTGKPGAPYKMAASNDENHFIESCTIQAGGTLTYVGKDTYRELVTYQPPLLAGGNATNLCTGKELFFEAYR